jgi:hypothetical protein
MGKAILLIISIPFRTPIKMMKNFMANVTRKKNMDADMKGNRGVF